MRFPKVFINLNALKMVKETFWFDQWFYRVWNAEFVFGSRGTILLSLQYSCRPGVRHKHRTNIWNALISLSWNCSHGGVKLVITCIECVLACLTHHITDSQTGFAAAIIAQRNSALLSVECEHFVACLWYTTYTSKIKTFRKAIKLFRCKASPKAVFDSLLCWSCVSGRVLVEAVIDHMLW